MLRDDYNVYVSENIEDFLNRNSTTYKRMKKENPSNVYWRKKKPEVKQINGKLKQNISHKSLKRKIKRRSNLQIKQMILEIIKDAKEKNLIYLTKEDIARCLQVKEKQVEQVFMELNREGILSQAIHHAPHDSNRDPWGFDGNKWWASDLYMILDKKE